jgi:hypothetical protein
MPPQRGAHFSPILHAVAGVVIPDGVFLRVVLLPERIPQGVLREHDPAFCHQQAEQRMSRQALRKSTRAIEESGGECSRADSGGVS